MLWKHFIPCGDIHDVAKPTSSTSKLVALTALLVVGSLFFGNRFQPLSTSDGCVGRVSAVGGVRIDASGAIERLDLDSLNTLGAQRRDALVQAEGDLQKASPMRKVSLRALEKALADNVQKGTAIPEEMLLLAGLQRLNTSSFTLSNKTSCWPVSAKVGRPTPGVTSSARPRVSRSSCSTIC